MIRKINEAEFAAATKSGVVLIDFYADWCGPCRTLAEILSNVDSKVGDRVNILKVDVDRERGLARRFGVSGIPKILIMKDGQVVNTMVGIRSEADLISAIDSA